MLIIATFLTIYVPFCLLLFWIIQSSGMEVILPDFKSMT